MILEIKNIARTNQQLWGLINEVINDSYFKLIKFFPTELLDQCKNIKMNLRTYQMKSKQIIKNSFGKWVVCTSGYDPPKGVR